MNGYAGVQMARILLSCRQIWTAVSHPRYVWCKIIGHDYPWTEPHSDSWCCRRCGFYDEGRSLVDWLCGRWRRLRGWFAGPTIIQLTEEGEE